MNRPEFIRGWLLLTTQPWGKAYRSDLAIATGEPSPAKIQMELYYQAFQSVEGSVWVKACEVQATGEHWPSIEAMRATVRNAKPSNPLLASARPANLITREEFGLDLYETIKTIGGILAIQDHMNAAVHQERSEQLVDLKKRRDVLRAALIPLMARLTSDEVVAIVERYPLVANL